MENSEGDKTILKDNKMLVRCEYHLTQRVVYKEKYRLCDSGGWAYQEFSYKWFCDGHEKNNKDNINHPSHYNQGKIEVIDFIIDQKMDYLGGNIIKYVSRYKHKNGIEDLKKARWYLERLITEQEKEK